MSSISIIRTGTGHKSLYTNRPKQYTCRTNASTKPELVVAKPESAHGEAGIGHVEAGTGYSDTVAPAPSRPVSGGYHAPKALWWRNVLERIGFARRTKEYVDCGWRTHVRRRFTTENDKNGQDRMARRGPRSPQRLRWARPSCLWTLLCSVCRRLDH